MKIKRSLYVKHVIDAGAAKYGGRNYVVIFNEDDGQELIWITTRATIDFKPSETVFVEFQTYEDSQCISHVKKFNYY